MSQESLLRGAKKSSGSTLRSRLKMGINQHIAEARKGLLELFKTPVSSFMTIAVLAIALALPAGFHVFLKNAQVVSSGWDSAAQISLFLQRDLTAKQVVELQQELLKSNKVSEVELVTKQEGLNEFQNLSGFGDALSLLENNPLPDTLVITPSIEFSGPDAAESLVSELQDLPEVDLARLDLQWVRKLYSMMNIAERAVAALSLLLALAVLLIVGNTIRLAVQNRREEIQIIKLVGATDAFIRRPFLYSGIWYGILAGLLGSLMVNISTLWLETPVRNLAGLYQSDFSLAGLNFIEVVQLTGIATLLGLIGSWLSVGRHIRDIEPK